MSEAIPPCAHCGRPCEIRCYLDVLIAGNRESVCCRNCFVARQESRGLIERRGQWVPPT